MTDAEPEAEPPIPPPGPVRVAPAPPPPPRPATPPAPLIVPEPEPTVVLTAPPAPVAPPPEPAPIEPSITMRTEPTPVEAPAARTRSGGPALVYPPNAPARTRPEPAKPSPSRPSKDDLAALDVLLNPRSHETPMAPLEAAGREDAWGPQFNEGEPRRVPRGVIVAGAVLVLAAVVVGGIWYYRENHDA